MTDEMKSDLILEMMQVVYDKNDEMDIEVVQSVIELQGELLVSITTRLKTASLTVIELIAKNLELEQQIMKLQQYINDLR